MKQVMIVATIVLGLNLTTEAQEIPQPGPVFMPIVGAEIDKFAVTPCIEIMGISHLGALALDEEVMSAYVADMKPKVYSFMAVELASMAIVLSHMVDEADRRELLDAYVEGCGKSLTDEQV